MLSSPFSSPLAAAAFNVETDMALRVAILNNNLRGFIQLAKEGLPPNAAGRRNLQQLFDVQ